MTSSLVGSEMCIRDSNYMTYRAHTPSPTATATATAAATPLAVGNAEGPGRARRVGGVVDRAGCSI
eukprot:9076006-Prorocentrum_lima.AAC.1